MTELTIAGALRELAARSPTAPAVRDETRALDRAGLIAESERWATVLAERGVVADDFVAVRIPNSVTTVTVTVAIWMLGATPQPVSERLGLEEQRALVDLGNARLVVGAAASDFPSRATIPSDTVLDGVARWSGPDLAARHWKALGSGGSTGRPKLVVAEGAAMVDPDRAVAPFIPREATQLVVAPLSHSAPFTYAMRGLMTGHALVVLPRFDPEATLAAIERHRATWVMLVPTMMARMARLADGVRAGADLSSLESILHIGGPCAPEVKRVWIDWIGAERVVEVYAGSESAGIAMIRGDEWLEHPGSVGRAVSGSRFRIVAEDGRELPAGELGLIEMRRETGASYSYRGADGAGAQLGDNDGWHTLGDLGSMDADGYLSVLDRRDDLIVTGGEKVYPVLVEQAAEEHPAVRSALALGIPDDDLGQAVALVIDVGDQEFGDEDQRMLIRQIGDRAGRAATPRALKVVHEPLRDDAGKARRRAWAAEFSGE